ncbi:MAG: aromatic/alkene monooxygenase hydroxylase subunit beta [Proteobacteria bacterium]|nr:aromatic/alkene monooxygenase hydroxylase subunit beta [Pseudomonadota bacterium]
MSDIDDLSKPLKTWSHLAANKRRPTEYEIVSTNLLWSTADPKEPWATHGHMSDWYVKYRNNSPLRHPDWDAFRDPDQLVYRTYNMTQDGQEAHVDGLINDHEKNDHDETLDKGWAKALAKLYTPGRYLTHIRQMSSAYLAQMVPASTIENCAMMQTADQLRWLSRIAYRTKALSLAHPELGFGDGERKIWEDNPAWQGFRELMENVLVAYDWGEQFIALNVVAMPVIDEAYVRQLGQSARVNGDTLLAMLADAQFSDIDRSRRWTTALVKFADQTPDNKAVMQQWVAKWVPLAEKAIDAFCLALPDNPDATTTAKDAARNFRETLGFNA